MNLMKVLFSVLWVCGACFATRCEGVFVSGVCHRFGKRASCWDSTFTSYHLGREWGILLQGCLFCVHFHYVVIMHSGHIGNCI